MIQSSLGTSRQISYGSLAISSVLSCNKGIETYFKVLVLYFVVYNSFGVMAKCGIALCKTKSRKLDAWLQSAIEGDMKLRVVVMDGEAARRGAPPRRSSVCSEYTLDDSVNIKGQPTVKGHPGRLCE
jgi:hypothetical protein